VFLTDIIHLIQANSHPLHISSTGKKRRFPSGGGDFDEAAPLLGLGRRLLHGHGDAHRVQA